MGALIALIVAASLGIQGYMDLDGDGAAGLADPGVPVRVVATSAAGETVTVHSDGDGWAALELAPGAWTVMVHGCATAGPVEVMADRESPGIGVLAVDVGCRLFLPLVDGGDLRVVE